MNTNEHDECIHDDTGPRRRWISPVVWSGLGLLAFVIYEATMQPALASVMLCIKFGWEDFRTSFWLKRHDPDRPRGRACRALFFASGLCKVALSATALFFVFAMIGAHQAAQPQQRQGKPPDPAFTGPLVTAILGYSLLTVAAGWAFWLAFVYEIRLWLHPSVHRDRRLQRWPPGMAYAGGRNRVGSLLFFSLFLVFFTSIMIFTIIVLVAANDIPQGAPRRAFVVGSLLMTLGGLPIAMLLLNAFLLRRLAARSPQECWAPVAAHEPPIRPENDFMAEPVDL